MGGGFRFPAYLLKGRWLAVALLALLARTLYGCSIALRGEDYLHTYLIGLKWFTTGIWPYWGPDVVHTQSQIPGALEGLLVGGPFFILAHPASPVVFLNILSFISLSAFGGYLSARLPQLPRWFIFSWLWFSPWTLNFSTTPINPSYVLVAALPFFAALFESYPIYTRDRWNPRSAWFIMGLTMGCVMQLHLSWVLMPCFMLPALILHVRECGWKSALPLPALSLAGMALALVTLYPTWMRYGDFMSGGVESNAVFNPGNLTRIFDLLFRTMGFAAYEVRHFIIGGSEAEWALIRTWPVIAPFLLLLLAAGMVQSGYYIFCLFRPRKDHAGWNWARMLTGGGVILLYLSFLFSIRKPASYSFYILLPLMVWFAMHALAPLLRKKLFQRMALLLLISNLIFHGILAVAYWPVHSIAAYGDTVMQALKSKDSRILGLRRVARWESMLQQMPWQESRSDTTLVFRQDFEYDDDYTRPENLYDTLNAGAGLSRRINRQHLSTPVFERLYGDIGKKKQVSVSMKTYCLKRNDAQLVIEVRKGDHAFFYHTDPLCSIGIAPGIWNRLEASHTFGDQIPRTATIRIAVALPPGFNGDFFLDDLEIEFW